MIFCLAHASAGAVIYSLFRRIVQLTVIDAGNAISKIQSTVVGKRNIQYIVVICPDTTQDTLP